MNQRLALSLVPSGASLRDAMRSLEASKSQIALVVDPTGRLLGTVTDGDLRRALLAGATLEAFVDESMNRGFFAVPANSSRAAVLELMQARQINQAPEVDRDGRVVGLHLLSEMLSSGERANSAVVLAGGRGTRLNPLTETLPKPMLPVAGRPILERIVLHLVGMGIRHIWLSVGYLSNVIERHFGNGHRFGCSIEYLREAEPLGTAGSLSLLAAARPARPFLVMNGDLVTEANLGLLIDAHEGGDQAATVAVQRYFQQLPFGSVEVDGDRLVSFTEKPTTERLINAGIYVLDPACLDLLVKDEALDMPDLLLRVQAANKVVRVFEVDGDWIDVGRHEELARARHGE